MFILFNNIYKQIQPCLTCLIHNIHIEKNPREHTNVNINSYLVILLVWYKCLQDDYFTK